MTPGFDDDRVPPPLSDPASPLVPCPPYRRDAVSLGPFDTEPFELQPLVWDLPNGALRCGPDMHRCLVEWLTGALETSGVALGSFDRVVVRLIAMDAWGAVQVVAGWIARANSPPGRGANGLRPPDFPRTPHPGSGTDPPDSAAQRDL